MGPWSHMQWPLIEMASDRPPCGGLWTVRSVRPAPRRHQRRIVGVLAAAGRSAGLAPRHCRIAATVATSLDERAGLPATTGVMTERGASPWLPPGCRGASAAVGRMCGAGADQR